MPKAQTLLEYAVIIAIVVAGLIGMMLYLERGLAGSWRRGLDEIGQQYSPRTTRSDIVLRQNSTVTTEVRTVEREDGKLTSITNSTIGPSTETRSGWERLGRFSEE